MPIRWGWLIVTALAYGTVGGYLLHAHLWEESHELAWTSTATARLLWAAVVFLVSTLWLSRRPVLSGRGRWMALHAAAAFVLGTAAAWGVLEYQMLGSEHPWDTDIPDDMLYCVSCVPRMPIVRQTLAAAVVGTIATAALAPLIAGRGAAMHRREERANPRKMM